MRRYLEVFRRGFWENVRFALSAIREHKLRAGLTILGDGRPVFVLDPNQLG